jgi:CRP-like cAMP-binding protein
MFLRPDELAVLGSLHDSRRSFPAGKLLSIQGDTDHRAFVLVSGWVCSFKLKEDGTRMVVDFQIPGDFLGLRSLLLRTSDHSFEAITEVEVSEVPKSVLLNALQQTPRLAAAVLWAASRDEAMVVEHLMDVGRRGAVVRTAHFLLELWLRLKLVGLTTPDGYHCPLTQYQLADALGMSAIHLNRCLRELREKELLSFQKGMVRFENQPGLIELAEFDDSYLDQAEPFAAM